MRMDSDGLELMAKRQKIVPLLIPPCAPTSTCPKMNDE
jgi:hypothetical protein